MLDLALGQDNYLPKVQELFSGTDKSCFCILITGQGVWGPTAKECSHRIPGNQPSISSKSNCLSRGHEFDTGKAPYSCGD